MSLYVYKCDKVISKSITQWVTNINIVNIYIYIYIYIYIIGDKKSGNKNSHNSLKKEVKYHYRDEITVITQ